MNPNGFRNSNKKQATAATLTMVICAGCCGSLLLVILSVPFEAHPPGIWWSVRVAPAAYFLPLVLYPFRLIHQECTVACRLLRQLADIELRLAAQDNSKRKDMSEVNKRNVKANMAAVTAKVTSVQPASQQSSA